MAARLQHLHSCAHALHRLHNWHKLHKAYHALGHITTFINAEMVKTQRRDLEPVLNWVEMMQHLGNCHRASETITTRSRPSVRSTEPRVRRLRRRNRRARARAMKRVPPNSRNREGGMKEGPPKSRTAAAGWSRDFDMPGPSRGFDTPGPSRGYDMPGPSRGFHTSGPPRHRNYDDMRERDQARKRDSVPTCCICHGRNQ
ncbi:uncharacterized protein LOC113238951 isoform X2 [Hyposmocoma kahamanoa]|uniref:uncharacterized protein LOC113238951 isoform X2 n=1 Tax=Hyposmocoma kahamanoa TaxID=1477025 RepID=UPI000E6D8B0D|nr:uncharacterized protein LOC113238951 isoform X2 [Hyposmocoma kahamanoa]